MVTVRFEGDGRPSHQTFHSDDIEPWDELEALRRKAEAPCDKHEGGECDCGKSNNKEKTEEIQNKKPGNDQSNRNRNKNNNRNR